MKKDLFYYLNNLFTKTEEPEHSDVKSIVWPVNRFLSMEKNLLEAIAFTTKYIFTLGPRYYTLLFRLIPKSNAPRNKYLKPEKDDSELINKYSRYFLISNKEAKDYIKILFKNKTQKEVYNFVGLEIK